MKRGVSMSKEQNGYQFATLAIHSHQEPEPKTGAVITPIYQTTTFAQEDAGKHTGYEYSRTGNPTRTVLEGVLADLEGGAHGLCFASGCGALTTLSLSLFRPGDHVLCGDDVYGGTYRFYDKVLRQYGVDIEFVDFTDPQNVRNHIKPNTKALYLETPTNPLLKMVDIEVLVSIAREKNLITVLDNTFATPYFQQPIRMGVDIVLHSTTKYIGGHSDVVGGALILKDDTYLQPLKFHQNTLGATPDPFAAWLTLRGVKTLAVRMRTHASNAMELAQYMESHPGIENVIYPGLPSHPQHHMAKKQMSGYGGMISVRVKGGLDESRTFMKSLKLFTLAESLGGIESLVEHPALMTHLSVEPHVRQSLGITDNLVRLSVGIEDVQDLKQDIAQALDKAASLAKV
jgi:cystathionine beta-lyase/cystathionine gamma-synthase